MRKTPLIAPWFVNRRYIQAVQVNLSNPTEVFNFCRGRLKRDGKEKGYLLLRTTKYGVLKVKHGDYITRNFDGVYDRMSKRLFNKLYKPAEYKGNC